MGKKPVLFIGLLLTVMVANCIVNADESGRKKMKIDLTDIVYTPEFNSGDCAYCKGKSLCISSIESLEDEESYYSADKKVKYKVDNLEDYMENWVKAAFEHAGLLIQEKPSYWQRAFQPGINVSVNQPYNGGIPSGMLDFRIEVPKYSESSATVTIEGYIDGRIEFRETIPVVFPAVPVDADKAMLEKNAFANLDQMAVAVLSNAKLRAAVEKTNNK